MFGIMIITGFVLQYHNKIPVDMNRTFILSAGLPKLCKYLHELSGESRELE